MSKSRYDTKGRQRHGDWQQTHTGVQFWALDPRSDEVFVEDIAHHLSLVCRYGGAANFHYSVAQHSVLASIAVERRLFSEEAPLRGPGPFAAEIRHTCLQALLHDAAEAYIGDMISPVKRQLPEFSEIEERILRQVGYRFGVELVALPSAVLDADLRMLVTEVKVLRAAPPPAEWRIKAEPYDWMKVEEMPWRDVKEMFLARFRELTT